MAHELRKIVVGVCATTFNTVLPVWILSEVREREDEKSWTSFYAVGKDGGGRPLFLSVDAPVELCSISCDIYTIWCKEENKKPQKKDWAYMGRHILLYIPQLQCLCFDPVLSLFCSCFFPILSLFYPCFVPYLFLLCPCLVSLLSLFYPCFVS